MQSWIELEKNNRLNNFNIFNTLANYVVDVLS